MNVIGQNELTPEFRRLYFWLVQSNGTSAATSEAGNSVLLSLNGGTPFTASATLSEVSASRGRFYLQLSTSEVSRPGVMQAFYSSATCFEQSNYGGPVTVMPQSVYIPQYMSWGSRLVGATSVSVTLASGETTTNDFLNGAGILIQYPDNSLAFNIISDSTPPTAQMANAFAVTPSSACTYYILPGTIAAALSAADVGSIGTDAAQKVWGYNMGAGRTTVQALYALRNRVLVTPGSSVGTVYLTDDATSVWTFSVSTQPYGFSGVDPT